MDKSSPTLFRKNNKKKLMSTFTDICTSVYNSGSDTMISKPILTLELRYPMT